MTDPTAPAHAAAPEDTPRPAAEQRSDDTIAQQLAAAMRNDQRGGRIEIPRTDYVVRRPLTIGEQQGLILRGQSVGDTRLFVQWDSDIPAADRVLFDLRNCDATELAHFSVIIRDDTLAVTRQRRLAPPAGRAMHTPTNNHFERIEVEGGGKLRYGHLVQNAGTDQNNEHATWHLCIVGNLAPGGSAWRIEGFNAMGHHLHRCGWGGGRYGVETTQGNFTARDCWGGSMSDADFFLGQPTAMVSIEGGDFELSRSLLATGGQAGTSFPVRIIGTRAACTDAKGEVVRGLLPGPWIIETCHLMTTNARRPVIVAWTFGEVGVAVRGCTFATRRSAVIDDHAAEFPVVVDRKNKPFRIRMEHNHFNTADDRYVFVPEWEGEFSQEHWPG